MWLGRYEALVAVSAFKTNISSVEVWKVDLPLTNVLGEYGACGDPSKFVTLPWFKKLVADAELESKEATDKRKNKG